MFYLNNKAIITTDVKGAKSLRDSTHFSPTRAFIKYQKETNTKTLVSLSCLFFYLSSY